MSAVHAKGWFKGVKKAGREVNLCAQWAMSPVLGLTTDDDSKVTCTRCAKLKGISIAGRPETSGADLIAAQDKIGRLQKKARELGERAKYAHDQLEKLKAGEYGSWSQADVERLTKMYTEDLTMAQGALALAGAEVIKLSALRPTELPFVEVLAFFTGNNQENARNALELVALSQKADQWVSGASRRVRSGLNPDKAAKKLVAKPEQKAAFKAAMAPLMALMDRWDNLRPAPTFTSVGVSKTITKTLESMKLDLNPESIRVCPIEWAEEERVDEKTGKVTIVKVGYLLWPEGTRHGKSRFTYGTARHAQCEACGHAIKNPFNWVPLLIDDKAGVPHSLWVGRDCSETIFGVKMEGELELKER